MVAEIEHERPEAFDLSDIHTKFPHLAQHQDYPRGGRRAALVDVLNRCIHNRCFPRSPRDRTKIHRSFLMKAADISEGMLQKCGGLLRDYEATMDVIEPAKAPFFHDQQPLTSELLSFPILQRHQSYKRGVKARVVKILNGCIRAGHFPRSLTMLRKFIVATSSFRLAMCAATWILA